MRFFFGPPVKIRFKAALIAGLLFMCCLSCDVWAEDAGPITPAPLMGEGGDVIIPCDPESVDVAPGGVVIADDPEAASRAFGGAVTVTLSGQVMTIRLEDSVFLGKPIRFKKAQTGDRIILELNGFMLCGEAGSSYADYMSCTGKNAIEIEAGEFDVEIRGPGAVLGGKGGVYESPVVDGVSLRCGLEGACGILILNGDPDYISETAVYGLSITDGVDIVGGAGADLTEEDRTYNIENGLEEGQSEEEVPLQCGLGGRAIAWEPSEGADYDLLFGRTALYISEDSSLIDGEDGAFYADEPWEVPPDNPDPGPPGVDPRPAQEIKRLFGSNRYKTSLAIAEELKRVLGVSKFNAVVLATGEDFPDALSGAYLAGKCDAPLLIINKKWQNRIVTYIKNNLSSGGTVYVLGSANVVPDDWIKPLKSSYTVRRLAGKNRYLTNLAILKEAGVPSGDWLFVATGANFADALSASAIPRPILLINPKKGLTAEQKAFLAELEGAELMIIGSTAAVPEEYERALEAYGFVTRAWGNNRFETSIEVAKTYFYEPHSAALACSQKFPDGLCGGVLAQKMQAPLLLVKTGKEAEAAKYVKDWDHDIGMDSGVVFGANSVDCVSDASVKKIFLRAKITKIYIS